MTLSRCASLSVYGWHRPLDTVAQIFTPRGSFHEIHLQKQSQGHQCLSRPTSRNTSQYGSLTRLITADMIEYGHVSMLNKLPMWITMKVSNNSSIYLHNVLNIFPLVSTDTNHYRYNKSQQRYSHMLALRT